MPTIGPRSPTSTSNSVGSTSPTKCSPNGCSHCSPPERWAAPPTLCRHGRAARNGDAEAPRNATAAPDRSTQQSQQGWGKSNTKRIEKVVYVDTKTITIADGEQSIRLVAEGGRIGLGDTSETGERVFVPLERVRTHRNPDKRGADRWYNDYRLPYALGVNAMSMHIRRHGLAPPVAA